MKEIDVLKINDDDEDDDDDGRQSCSNENERNMKAMMGTRGNGTKPLCLEEYYWGSDPC